MYVCGFFAAVNPMRRDQEKSEYSTTVPCMCLGFGIYELMVDICPQVNIQVTFSSLQICGNLVAKSIKMWKICGFLDYFRVKTTFFPLNLQFYTITSSLYQIYLSGIKVKKNGNLCVNLVANMLTRITVISVVICMRIVNQLATNYPQNTIASQWQ